ncbi:Calcium-binding component of the spindle pole body (SPB) half-bridge [Coemansia guatemalensis]|uniref:Calcium-binding component of the spindle pole body (SPB) half-bridge n=1 Tax=Coemansia guatemalensis TaxID=2761395 RepID=A0A9W8HUY9_9FUNG|nr:Calcium-binding component of the spindle pole body (SPB) half-bridge [Coemansia guatemalensis]
MGNGFQFNATSRNLVNPRPLRTTDNKFDETKEAFLLFDANKDGFIDYFEFKVALRALGFNSKKEEVLRLMDQFGTKDGSKIDLNGFQKAVHPMIAALDPIDEYKKAFRLIDENATGIITAANLRRVARELDESISDEEIQAMIDEFDFTNHGGIIEEDFIKIMESAL